MPKVLAELSARAVAALKAEGRHAVGGVPGLHLRIANSHRGWVLRVTVGEQRRDLGLGPYPEIGLSEAREKAREMHKSVRQGIDPLVSKRAQRSALAARQAAEKNFDACAQGYIASKADEWKNPKHLQQWENTLKTYASPHIGHLLVRDIELRHILSCLEPIWRTKNETASRLRGRIESILDWAAVRGHRSGDNPARWKGHLDKVLPAPSKIQNVEHHAALAIDDMPAFILQLMQRDGMSARALEFAILTAARSGEVRGATWSEIDIQSGLWIVPPERMKAKREHRVPLSREAIDLLKALPRETDDGLLFPGTKGRPLSDMSISAVLKRMQVPAVPHGFRSTFRDWAGDRTEYPRDLAEFALAHAIGDKTEEAYRRKAAVERRRLMMEDWTNFIGFRALTSPPNSGLLKTRGRVALTSPPYPVTSKLELGDFPEMHAQTPSARR